jgi:hypothetical protein
MQACWCINMHACIIPAFVPRACAYADSADLLCNRRWDAARNGQCQSLCQHAHVIALFCSQRLCSCMTHESRLANQDRVTRSGNCPVSRGCRCKGRCARHCRCQSLTNHAFLHAHECWSLSWLPTARHGYSLSLRALGPWVDRSVIVNITRVAKLFYLPSSQKLAVSTLNHKIPRKVRITGLVDFGNTVWSKWLADT